MTPDADGADGTFDERGGDAGMAMQSTAVPVAPHGFDRPRRCDCGPWGCNLSRNWAGCEAVGMKFVDM